MKNLVGESQTFQQVRDTISTLAGVDATVLVTGETGTGKELAARAIHYGSRRRGEAFVALNCSALPEQLVENELFGHARGAYTNAASASKGLVAEAEGGTLFFDELETLSAAAQAKVLRFLQNQEYRPLGTTRSRTADVRIIAATNDDLGRAVAEKRFRADLFYRLHVLYLHLPRLAERTGDVPLLATHFLECYRREYGRAPSRFAGATLRRLSSYTWPGNVRELEAVIHRAVVLSPHDVLQPDDIELGGPHGKEEVPPGETLQQAKQRMIDRFERRYLIDTMAACRGNVSRAAKSAGKERRTFQRLLRKHSIERRSFLA